MRMDQPSTEYPAGSIDFLPLTAGGETNVTRGVGDQTPASPWISILSLSQRSYYSAWAKGPRSPMMMRKRSGRYQDREIMFAINYNDGRTAYISVAA